MSENKNESSQSITFDAIKIGLASPEKIREWSKGKVTTTASPEGSLIFK